MKVVFASNNPGKIQELRALLSSVKIELIPQAELGISEVEENALSFVENALLKARHACQESGLPAIADDSGLVVNALQGAPGIYSARYAGLQATAKANWEKLLEELKQVPATERQAFFYCALVYLSHEKDPRPLICEGIWQGRILNEARGSEGFGYDPIFAPSSENKSAAELPLALKNSLSHRSQALGLLLAKLADQ